MEFTCKTNGCNNKDRYKLYTHKGVTYYTSKCRKCYNSKRCEYKQTVKPRKLKPKGLMKYDDITRQNILNDLKCNNKKEVALKYKIPYISFCRYTKGYV